MNNKYLWLVAGFFIILITLSSCVQKILGYGTILWAPDNSILPTGQTVTIISESELEDTYLLRDEVSGESIQIKRWRVEVFDKESLAKERSKTILKYKTIFARNLRDGLLIREKASINSKRVYRLKKDQIVKILDQNQSISTVGQYEGNWYKVITEDGISGYSFDQYLDIYDSSEKPEKQINPVDLLMNASFATSYYPSVFIDMIKNNTIDLELFRSQIGLFPDIKNKNLKVVTNTYSISFTWDSLILIDKRSFKLGKTNTIITVLSDTDLQITYYYENKKIIANYVVIENIKDIIIEEEERRKLQYNSLLEEGSRYSSNAYGNISMQSDGNFKWTNFDRLTPQIIPYGSTGAGKISFNNFLPVNMGDEYTGVISFNFIYGEKIIPVNFLYTLVNKKLRLTFIPEKNIINNIVKKKSASPIIIAFSAD